ncbi:MAG: hypothetical protein KAT43_06365 [Nanoarchaeota archaeon]|nr:hypothetical protein [Nanoarchaeota archaeon]
MKKIILVSFLLSLLVIMTACGPKAVITPGDIEIETPDGKVTVKPGKYSSWCQEGATWDYAGAQGEAANWKIVGIEDYKGGKFCHVVYEVKGGAVEGAMPMMVEYYFSEDQKDIYMIFKDETGKVVNEQHITA